MLVGGLGLGVWLCCGRPCCSCHPHSSDGIAEHAKHGYHGGSGDGYPRGGAGGDYPPSYVTSARATDRSTDELAEALTAVLKTHRCGTAREITSQRHA